MQDIVGRKLWSWGGNDVTTALRCFSIEHLLGQQWRNKEASHVRQLLLILLMLSTVYLHRQTHVFMATHGT